MSVEIKLKARSSKDLERMVKLFRWENKSTEIFDIIYSESEGLFIATITHKGYDFPVYLGD